MLESTLFRCCCFVCGAFFAGRSTGVAFHWSAPSSSPHPIFGSLALSLVDWKAVPRSQKCVQLSLPTERGEPTCRESGSGIGDAADLGQPRVGENPVGRLTEDSQPRHEQLSSATSSKKLLRNQRREIGVLKAQLEKAKLGRLSLK